MRTKRAFEVKQKTFFIIFKGLSVAKKYLRPQGAPLKRSVWLSISLEFPEENLRRKKALIVFSV